MPLSTWHAHLLRQWARPWLIACLIAGLFLVASFAYVGWLRWRYGFGQ